MVKKVTPPAPPVAPSVVAPEIETESGTIPEVVAQKVSSKKGFFVNDGKAVTCGTVRVVLGPNDEITAAHLSNDKDDGVKSLQALVASGTVREVK